MLGSDGESKGFIDREGQIAVSQIYEDAGDFSRNLAPVKSAETKLWGYIDNLGALIIPMEYEKAESFHDGVAYVTSANQAYSNGYGSSYLINRQGERLTPLWSYGFHSGETMQDGLLRVLYP